MSDVTCGAPRAPRQGFTAAALRCENDKAPPSTLLAALEPPHRQALAPMMTTVSLRAGQVLHTAGFPVQDVYFVETGLVSLAISFAEGQVAPATLVGPEGIVGICSAMNDEPATDSAKVVMGGEGYRLPAKAVRRIFLDHPHAAAAIASAIARQVAELQVELACRTCHSVEQRLARLLLHTCERLGSDRLIVTQEELASILGVQRTTVSATAANLKERGAITYLRGAVRIADRRRLSTVACNCGALSVAVGPDLRPMRSA